MHNYQVKEAWGKYIAIILIIRNIKTDTKKRKRKSKS